jgi:hypothetical protein
MCAFSPTTVVDSNCRFCGKPNLLPILDLGLQPLSGVFPKLEFSTLETYPLVLSMCEACVLVQLLNTAPLKSMYGEDYGYRSGLNPSMIKHLGDVADFILGNIKLEKKTTILDIGSNDGTFLNNFFDSTIFNRIGIDPSAGQFSHFYTNEIKLIVDFFSKEIYLEQIDVKPNIVTSIAMFYDLERPFQFARDIHELLEEEGYWYLEVCYGPWIGETGSFDTICHEHLEYYSAENINNILKSTGFKVVKTLMSSTNGVSVGVLAQKVVSNEIVENNSDPLFDWLLSSELSNKTNSKEKWLLAAKRIQVKRQELLDLLVELKALGNKIYGMGASTKGNVLLNYLGLNSHYLTAIGEINESKFEKVTPGSLIPIISEEAVFQSNPDYLVFLPWHFRDFAIEKYSKYLNNGGKIIFPLPNLEIFEVPKVVE